MFKKMILCLLVCILPPAGLSGCAGKYGKQTTQVERYPQCYAPIRKLREGESAVAGTTAGGAAAGAILGALIGALATGKVEGVAAGGVAGGVAGGAIGYSRAKQRQIRDQNARMAAYLRDLDGDIAGIDAVNASARHSLQCYDREFNLLVADYKSGRISRIELDRAYQEIKNGMGEAGHLLGATAERNQARDEQYEAAVAGETRTVEDAARQQRRGPRYPAALDRMRSRVVGKKLKTAETAELQRKFADTSRQQQLLLDNIDMANG
ncbi:MAG: hypothetical protein LBN96_08775 [Desulfovibrio sp.]|jgi:uncharacterized protein YcfJ|nr:hypothetical protein [Desulfovibrio sp.]